MYLDSDTLFCHHLPSISPVSAPLTYSPITVLHQLMLGCAGICPAMLSTFSLRNCTVAGQAASACRGEWAVCPAMPGPSCRSHCATARTTLVRLAQNGPLVPGPVPGCWLLPGQLCHCLGKRWDVSVLHPELTRALYSSPGAAVPSEAALCEDMVCSSRQTRVSSQVNHPPKGFAVITTPSLSWQVKFPCGKPAALQFLKLQQWRVIEIR